MIVIYHDVGLAVTLHHLYDILASLSLPLAMLVCPIGYKGTVAHVCLLNLIAQLDTHNLCEQTVLHLTDIACLVGLSIGQKTKFNHLLVGKVV